jgi:hypothetical protein
MAIKNIPSRVAKMIPGGAAKQVGARTFRDSVHRGSNMPVRCIVEGERWLNEAGNVAAGGCCEMDHAQLNASVSMAYRCSR